MTPGPISQERGEVLDYDDAAGIGIVRAQDGADYFFHCTSIADGSRMIAQGTPVSFAITAGRQGLWEAIDVAPRQL